MNKYLVAIDPGVSAGVAVFDIGSQRLIDAHTVKGRGRTWEERVYEVATQVFRILDAFTDGNGPIVRIVCEYPAFMPTPGGIKVAKRGDLVKLAHVVGVLHCRMYASWGTFELVPVNIWKGQASKDIINNRIAKILPWKERVKAGMTINRSHDWDAVGIGLWALKRKKETCNG